MTTENTDGNANGENLENENNSSTNSSEGENNSNTDGNKNSAKTYTEAEYKGLQAVIAKRDQTIANITNKNQQLENEIADLKSKHGTAVSEKTDLDQKLTESSEEMTKLNNKITELEKKIQYQGIVMKDFPELSPFIDLIPKSENEEDFRAKAKEVQTTLGKYVGDKVKNTLSGSSPPLSGGDDSDKLNPNQEDELYRDVVNLAGIPGKEPEYEKAYQKYRDYMNSKK